MSQSRPLLQMRFNPETLMPADILAGRNIDPEAKFGPAIRAITGGYTNHNALFVINQNPAIAPRGAIVIGDTTPPEAAPAPLSKYADLINAGTYIVRVWRVKDMSDEERLSVSSMWWLYSNHHPYPGRSVKRLWIMRLVNHLPYEIPGRWCTRNSFIPFGHVLPPKRNPMMRPDGVMKKNPTPRTPENRLVAGILEDVTDEVCIHIPQGEVR